MAGLPSAVPSSVAPSTVKSVPVLTEPQLGPNTGGSKQPGTGKVVNPKVPRTEVEGVPACNPEFGGYKTQGRPRVSGSAGAPSVPAVGGALFTSPPIDPHYQNEDQGGRNPYRKINNPPTRGMLTWVKAYLNNAAHTAQDVDNAGWRVRPGQQRTSWMRITPPPHGNGYSPETFVPKQQPQSPNTYKYNPATGTQAYGTGVLNSDSFGAGQTAGGQGGNNYTPAAGPPATTSTAGQSSGASSMPTWG